jgi:hypothetical protein
VGRIEAKVQAWPMKEENSQCSTGSRKRRLDDETAWQWEGGAWSTMIFLSALIFFHCMCPAFRSTVEGFAQRHCLLQHVCTADQDAAFACHL